MDLSVPRENVRPRIHTLRGRRVMLDADLAAPSVEVDQNFIHRLQPVSRAALEERACQITGIRVIDQHGACQGHV